MNVIVNIIYIRNKKLKFKSQKILETHKTTNFRKLDIIHFT